jgi:hypothetical protein
VDESEDDEPFDLTSLILKQKFISDEDKQQLVKEIQKPVSHHINDDRFEYLNRAPSRERASTPSKQSRSHSASEMRPNTPQQKAEPPKVSAEIYFPHSVA